MTYKIEKYFQCEKNSQKNCPSGRFLFDVSDTPRILTPKDVVKF